ncbi:MAG: hypothetical protein AAFO81_03585 [Pseudomonadota bacterium]
MSERHYCWRCKIDVPLLNETEWTEIEPLLRAAVRDVKEYRSKTHAELAEALEKNQGVAALQRHKELTGFVETNVNAIWHHRRSNYGDPCPDCGKLLRTPRATLCPECGYAENCT